MLRTLSILLCLGTLAVSPAAAETRPAPTKVAVYAFELEDFSAGGAYFPPDERDKAYVEQATQEAARQLAGSGRYAIVDMGGATDEPVKPRTMRSCNGCIGPITRKLGAEQAVLGIITRISGVGFEEAYANKRDVSIEGLQVPVISLEDLIANKRASGRMQDLADVEKLETLRKK